MTTHKHKKLLHTTAKFLSYNFNYYEYTSKGYNPL
jgi:hypothetical protein